MRKCKRSRIAVSAWFVLVLLRGRRALYYCSIFDTCSANYFRNPSGRVFVNTGLQLQSLAEMLNPPRTQPELVPKPVLSSVEDRKIHHKFGKNLERKLCITIKIFEKTSEYLHNSTTIPNLSKLKCSRSID